MVAVESEPQIQLTPDTQDKHQLLLAENASLQAEVLSLKKKLQSMVAAHQTLASRSRQTSVVPIQSDAETFASPLAASAVDEKRASPAKSVNKPTILGENPQSKWLRKFDSNRNKHYYIDTASKRTSWAVRSSR